MEAKGENAAPRAQTKRPNKRRRERGSVQISDTMDGIAEEMRKRTAVLRALTAYQKAVRILQKDYADQLPKSTWLKRLMVVADAGVVSDAWFTTSCGLRIEVIFWGALHYST